MSETKSNVWPRSGTSRCRVQVPFMSTQGETGVPPPQTPAVQVSPVVQKVPSSQALPSAAGVHTDGSPVHVQQGSTRHSASQPSPAVVLPSSHVQRVATTGPGPGWFGGRNDATRPWSTFSLGVMRPNIPATLGGGRLAMTLKVANGLPGVTVPVKGNP